MKKFTIIICLILVFLLVYLLQVNFFSWFNLAGVKPNLFIIFVLVIGLFSGKSRGMLWGIIFGITLDFLIGKRIGITAISLGMIGFLGGFLDKNFSKDSRMTMITMVILATAIYEIITYVLHYAMDDAQLGLYYFIPILVLELIYHTLITIIIYPLILKWGYPLEENFKKNTILTRYF